MPHNCPLFARQAIYDKQTQVAAYELLFRHSNENRAEITSGDQATFQVVTNAFGDHELDEMLGEHKAFVNFTRNLLLSPPELPKDKLVIEVLEDIEADDAVLKALASLKQSGYSIALDDYFITEQSEKMVEFADIVKIDVLSLSRQELEEHVDKLKRHKVKLLAEKIEDHKTMDLCKSLGFDMFQGYFLCRPQIVTGLKTTEGKQAILRLVSALNDPSIEFDKIVETIASDPNLSYKILRLVNSSAIGIPRTIESLSQAVSMLGLNTIKNWSTYLLMANNDDKPRELSIISMCRAKFCELIGTEIENKQMGDICFTAGLLSNLDAFLDLEMCELTQKLKLAKPIEDALIKHDGTVGEVLRDVSHYEKGEWADIDWPKWEKKNLMPDQVNRFYGESILWATEVVQAQI